MNKYMLSMLNCEIIVTGCNEYDAIMSTGIIQEADMIDCYNTITQIWGYKVKINGNPTIAVVSKIWDNEPKYKQA